MFVFNLKGILDFIEDPVQQQSETEDPYPLR